RRPVAAILAEALPVSLALGGVSLFLSFVIGAAVGLLQAAWRGRAPDRVLTVLTTMAYAAPSFWLALALVALFTYGAATWGFPAALRLPAFGMHHPAGTPGGWWTVLDVVRHAILPVTVLTLVGAAGIARYARSAAADVLGSPFVRTARAKGAGPLRVHGRHVLRNALPPLVCAGVTARAVWGPCGEGRAGCGAGGGQRAGQRSAPPSPGGPPVAGGRPPSVSRLGFPPPTPRAKPRLACPDADPPCGK